MHVRLVELKQFLEEEVDCPGVGDDVVHIEGEQVVSRLDLYHTDEERRALFQVEGGANALIGQLQRLRPSRVERKLREIDPLQWEGLER